MLIDINGYFAPPDSGGLSLYALTPCRVLDTRKAATAAFTGELTVHVVNSRVRPPAAAQAYVFNATVVPPGSLGYLTLWPDGETAAGGLDAERAGRRDHVEHGDRADDQRQDRRLCHRHTQLMLDISSYFAP